MKVFICGTVDKNIDKKYLVGIDKIAKNLAENDDATLSVGAHTGAIGEIYNNMQKYGGHIHIIEPTVYMREADGLEVDSFLEVDSLYMLQQIALRNTGATLILPGGNGTLAELYMITDSIKSKFDTDMVIIYNINGFYDHIKAMNDFMLEVGTMQKYQYDFFNWCDTADEVIALLDKARKKQTDDIRKQK